MTNAACPRQCDDDADGHGPGHQVDGDNLQGVDAVGALGVQGGVGDQRCRPTVLAVPALGGLHGVRCPAAERPSDDGGGGDDHGERNREDPQGHERRNGQDHQGRVAQRSAADSDHGLRDDGEHRRRQASEQRGDHGGVAGSDIDRGQAQQGHDTGEHEQGAAISPPRTPLSSHPT